MLIHAPSTLHCGYFSHQEYQYQNQRQPQYQYEKGDEETNKQTTASSAQGASAPPSFLSSSTSDSTYSSTSNLQQQRQEQQPGSVPRESGEHGAVAAKGGVEGSWTSPSSDALDRHPSYARVPVISTPSDISETSSVSSMFALTSETATAKSSVEFTKGTTPITGYGMLDMTTLEETKAVAYDSKDKRMEAKEAGYPNGGTERCLAGNLDSGNGGKEATATPVKPIASLKPSKLDCAHGETLESSYSDFSSEEENEEEEYEDGEPEKGAAIVKALAGLAGKEASKMAKREKYASSTDKLDLSVRTHRPTPVFLPCSCPYPYLLSRVSSVPFWWASISKYSQSFIAYYRSHNDVSLHPTVGPPQCFRWYR